MEIFIDVEFRDSESGAHYGGGTIRASMRDAIVNGFGVKVGDKESALTCAEVNKIVTHAVKYCRENYLPISEVEGLNFETEARFTLGGSEFTVRRTISAPENLPADFLLTNCSFKPRRENVVLGAIRRGWHGIKCLAADLLASAKKRANRRVPVVCLYLAIAFGVYTGMAFILFSLRHPRFTQAQATYHFRDVLLLRQLPASEYQRETGAKP